MVFSTESKNPNKASPAMKPAASTLIRTAPAAGWERSMKRERKRIAENGQCFSSHRVKGFNQNCRAGGSLARRPKKMRRSSAVRGLLHLGMTRLPHRSGSGGGWRLGNSASPGVPPGPRNCAQIISYQMCAPKILRRIELGPTASSGHRGGAGLAIEEATGARRGAQGLPRNSRSVPRSNVPPRLGRAST